MKTGRRSYGPMNQNLKYSVHHAGFFVRRRVGERMVPQCVTPTVKHGGGSVMIWGSFAGSRVGDLHRMTGTLNQKIYHSILQRHAIPSGLRLVGQGFILQQDKNPKHTLRLCQNYLRRKEQDNSLQIKERPAQSPDLNPVELVCDELDRRVKAKQPTSATHLWELLQQCWEELSEQYLIFHYRKNATSMFGCYICTRWLL